MNISELKQLLKYDKDTGDFTWLKSVGGLAKSGSIAGSIDSKGYRQIRVNGMLYLAHRLAWLYEYGDFPDAHIDHIDRNPKNNAISNLRLCTHAQNHQNTGVRSDNTSGVTGVSYVNQNRKWLAYINVGGKRLKIGLFKNVEDAIAARLEAKRKYHSFSPHQ